MGDDGMLLDFLIEHKGESLTFIDLNPISLTNMCKESLIYRLRDEGIIDYTCPGEWESIRFSFVSTKNAKTEGLYAYYTATIKEKIN